MNKKISMVKDVFSNTPHIIAISENDVVKMKALSEFGKSIMEDFNYEDGYSAAQTPDGFVKTEFKELSHKLEEVFTSAFSEIGWNNQKVINAANEDISKKQTSKLFHKRISKINSDATRQFKNPASRSIFRFKDKFNKRTITNYKAQTFKNNSFASSLAEKIKSNEISFNAITNSLSLKSKNSLSEYKFSAMIDEPKNTRVIRRSLDISTKDASALSRNKKRRILRRASSISKDAEKEQKETSGSQKFSEIVKSKFNNRKRFMR